MKISFDSNTLFNLISTEEDQMMTALHDYFDGMYGAN